jgi:hypothetical protein
MATPPDFSVGQVLTAAHMDAVGLWLIDQETVTAQSTITFDDVFTSDYVNYLITVNFSAISTSTTFRYVLRSAGSNNASNNTVTTGFYQTVGTATVNGDVQAAITYGKYGYSDTNGAAGTLKMFQPKLANYTYAHSDILGNNFLAHYDMVHQTTTAYDGIQFTTASGTMTGTVRVYGYRN